MTVISKQIGRLRQNADRIPAWTRRHVPAGRRALAKIIKLYLVLCFGFVVLYPVFYMVSRAFMSLNDVHDPSVIWVPKTLQLESFRLASQMMSYLSSALKTGGVALAATLLQMISCALAGYGFARFRFPGKRIFFAICLFSIIVPSQMITIPSFLQIKYFNVLGIGSVFKLFTGAYPDFMDTPWAVLIPALLANGIRGSMYIYIFRQFFRGIPKDLEDAAYIDGAGHVTSFVRVIMPLAGAPFLVVFILSFIWYWNDATVMTFFYPSLRPIAVQLLNIATGTAASGVQYTINQLLAIQQAGAFLMILPPLVLYLVLQRHFVESIDKTGLK